MFCPLPSFIHSFVFEMLSINARMSIYNYFLFYLFLLTNSSKEIQLTNRNSFHYIHCNNDLYVKINSIKYIYNKYNCTFIINDNDYKRMNLCLNQSTCILKLKSFLIFHIKHHMTKCRTIVLKSIKLNYSCINDKLVSIKILTQPKNNHSGINYTKTTIIICLCLIIVISLFAFTCSFIQNSIMNKIQNNRQSIYDNDSKQNHELKILSLKQSSSSSTLTSLYNNNSITNPSEYDNLTKDLYQ